MNMVSKVLCSLLVAILAGLSATVISDRWGARSSVSAYAVVAVAGQSKTDGTLVSETRVPSAQFPSYIAKREALYSIEYWSRDTEVQAYIDVPPGDEPSDVVLFLHGGETLPTMQHDNSSYYSANVATSVAFPGSIMVLPNYAGYGPSSGNVGSPQDDLIDTENALKALQQMSNVHANMKKIYVNGVSLGGDVGMMLAAVDANVRAVELLSPYPGPATFMQWYSSMQGSNNTNTIVTQAADDYLQAYGTNINSDGYQQNSFTYQRINIPVLIIGGREDTTIPPSLLQYMTNKLHAYDNDVQLRFVDGGHAPQTAQVNNLLAQWLVQEGA